MENIEELKNLVGTDINRYTITKYINSGSFGHVLEARDKKTGELVALKIPVTSDDKNGQTSLIEEGRIYKKISNPEKGVPNVKMITSKDKKVMVMDLLGPSIETLISKYKKIAMKTVIRLAISMLQTMKYIHSCGYIHRDVKPDNFVIGINNPQDIYCIDYGLAKRYLKKNGTHIDFSDKKRFCGTARYASIAAHRNCEQSCKDDLESIGYILVYLYKGKLPWQGIKHKDKKERYMLIGKKKEDISEEELCQNMPKEFCVYLKYVKTLDFDEKPYYNALIKMFTKLYESRGYKNDKLEWE